MNTRKAFRAVRWVAFFVLLPALRGEAQLTPLNFVYSGSGGITDPLRFALERGFFKKHNLDVTMIYVSSGVTAAQTLVSGSAVAANITVSDVLRPMVEGAPMKIVTVNVDRFQHLFVARPGISSAKEMKGKKIAVSRYGAFSDIQTRFLIRQWGMDPDKDVQVLQIGNSAARAAALVSGGVDGAIVTPSFIPFAKKAGLNVIFDLSSVQTKFANIGIIVVERLIREQPHIVKALVKGYVEGIKQWKSNPDAAKTYLKKLYPLSDSDIDGIYSDTNRFVRADPTPDIDGIKNLWESVPDLKARGPVDLQRFVDARFVDEALREMK